MLAGPSWLDWDRFDVAAKAPPATTRNNLNLMLQKLLADRFQLVVHKDTKPMPAYALTAGKGKPKMKEASGPGEPACQNVPQKPEPGTVPYVAISCHNVTMTAFIDVLGGYGGGTYLADPVVDQTGLSGAWDFDLKFTARNRLAQAGSDGISLFDAVGQANGFEAGAEKGSTRGACCRQRERETHAK